MPSFTTTLLAALSASSLSLAMTVTSPTKFQLWDSSKSNTITWTSVSTDAQTIDIYLAHMAAHPPLYSLLFSKVPTSQGSATVSGLQLPNGEAYQINLVAVDNSNQILAQSQQFNVTGEAVAATSTLDGYTGPTYTPTKSSGESAATKSVTKTASLTTITSTSTDANGSTVTGTSTSTATSDNAESTESATETSADETSSQTETIAAASTSATQTPNAAAGGYVASGSVFAMVFGVAAFLA